MSSTECLRMKLPETLRREEIIIEPQEDITGCKKMGEEITEVLEYEPGELYVKQYKRIKYAKPGNSGVVVGELPCRPIEKARRMFNEALDNDNERATHALEEIQKLYTIERICQESNLNFAELKVVRCKKAAPILKKLGQWMQQQYIQVLPKSAIGKALAYSIERWDKLSLYITDGQLRIDNNPVENSIRPIAIGRKNYLFAGSHEAAKRSGMLYSLLGICKMHNIEPDTWLKEVLQIIPQHPVNRVDELLPHRYRK